MNPATLRALCWGLLAILLLPATTFASDRVGPVPDSLREQLNLAPFYQKHTDLEGFPILGSSNVSDYALLEAAWIVRQMLTNRADILDAMATNRVRLTVMAWNEFTTDVPEHSDLRPAARWDRRARGLGATPARPAVSCAEENLLGFPGDPYSTENILIHEFAHAIHEMGMLRIDPAFDARLREAYRQAKEAGLWQGTYAATNPKEDWAEGVQSWFDNNRQNDSAHNHVNTRAELKDYDPELAKLCAEVFGDRAWRYQKPLARAPQERAHLAGYDATPAPRFRWRTSSGPKRPRVTIRTDLGEIQVELDAKAAPITVTNFLRYVEAGLYNGGMFHRTVTLSNQPTNSIKIEVIQAQANPAQSNAFPAPILLERTRDTGLRHRHGTLSMARAEPDSAQDHFFICLGDQPELDFGGRRNPDGQGFAAFGRVVAGMEVVRRIHEAPAEGQKLTPPVRIQSATRMEAKP